MVDGSASNLAAPRSQLFGMFFNFGLMGSLVVQVYHYYIAFPKDRAVTKALVYTLFVLELTQTGIMTYFAYTVFGAGYGNLDVFEKSALEWFPVCILGSIIAGMVQLFYAHRLFALSGSRIAGGIVAFLAVVQIGSGIGQGIISKLLVDRSGLTQKPICIWLVSTALCDLLIAGFMSFYLKRGQVISTAMKNTIAKIVRYTVETGAITAAVALVQLIVQHTKPLGNNYFEVLLNARALTVGGRDYVATDHKLTNEINFRGDVTTETQLDEIRTTASTTSSIRFENHPTRDTGLKDIDGSKSWSRTLGDPVEIGGTVA
ncbi:hypothetical protein B0H16DRAFT_1844079 [Mycena metata]|uniref:DUF6534 domain-containing protein n=1 Tax=Mycena metata TaxID=1033252 RepID=A0AAD7IU97_9AGAR|nr:hypothetical protein B0H16DRAFT_1844079 [Mycena metata]